MPSNLPQQFVRQQDVPAPILIQEQFEYDAATDSYVVIGYQLGLPAGNGLSLSEAQDVANFILNRTGGEPLPF